MQTPTSRMCSTLYARAVVCRNLHSVHSVQLNSVYIIYIGYIRLILTLKWGLLYSICTAVGLFWEWGGGGGGGGGSWRVWGEAPPSPTG